MKRARFLPWLSVSIVALLACGADVTPRAPEPTALSTPSAPAFDPGPAPSNARVPPPAGARAVPTTEPLHVRFLGVAGFLLEHGGESVLTAPLFTRPSMIAASTGLPVASDGALVDKYLPSTALVGLKAIVSGHAHYDHLLDVPAVMARAPEATLYANRSAKNLLAAYAPDRAPACSSVPAQPATIARARVVAVDDPLASAVDYRNCPDERPPGAPLEGHWVTVPGAHVRILPVCSSHPDQIGPIHFAPGSVDEEACSPPERMDAWLEGLTIAYLVDFLDPATGAPVYRVYYQDAPTTAPVGHVPAPLLADKHVDLALLCVGNYDRVEDAPTQTLDALTPRFALGGHWEDFFVAADQPIQPLPFTDLDTWVTKARAALPASAEARPMLSGGATLADRALLPQPGDAFDVVP